MIISIIDAQGGGVGKQLITAIRQNIIPDYPDVRLHAIGTNSIATSAMLKAGADAAATGENAIIVAARKSDIIVGPIGIVIADSLMGEITPAMSVAIGQSDACKVFIPFNHCDNIIVGVPDLSMSRLIAGAVEEIKGLLANPCK